MPSIDDNSSDSNLSDAAVHEAGAADPSVVEHRMIRHWEAGAIDAHLARKIGSDTGCSIEQKLDSAGMLVKGVSAHDVDRAISKLDAFWGSIVS